ncbi:MAG: HNH endonuclease signature motif containing protein [Polyangiaceae bacterium]
MQSTARARTYPLSHPRPLLLLRERITGDAEPEKERAPATSPPVLEPEAASDWTKVHERLVWLGAARAAHERDVCRWLLAAQRLGVHARAGYASLAELSERVLGLNARRTEERLRVGRALGDLRLLDGALAAGELPWSAVRELTRVATRETEQAWLEWAKGRRVRQIEAAVAARKPGDGPRDRSDPSRIKHRLLFEVRGETMALFRDMQSAVRADLGGDVDDDALLYEIARRVLGGPGDDGRASYQVAVSRCGECGRSRIDAAGTSHPVDEVVMEMALCDGQLLDPGTGARTPAATMPAQNASRRGRAGSKNPHVGDRDDGPHVADRNKNPQVGDRDDGPHVGDRRPRATQTIPPATRRAVMRRDHRRCVVPGCSNHRYLDVHHLDPRCEGGGHHPERLAVLCGAHHRAAHLGLLCIDGTHAAGFVFRHGDGTPYGGNIGVIRLDLVRQALGALEQMGFKPPKARALVDDALRAAAHSDVATLLHAALRAT